MKCKTTGGKQKLQLVKESFQCIPILETLKALLNHPDILAEVYNIIHTCKIIMTADLIKNLKLKDLLEPQFFN